MILSASLMNAQFTQQFLNTWNGVGYREYYNIQTMQDNSGNIYVAAGFLSIDSIAAATSLPIKRPAGFVVVKYNAGTLAQAWNRVVESSFCDFKSMAISSTGDAYVAATMNVSGQGNNAQFYRYASSNGALAANYPKTYNSAGTNNDEAVGIAVNSSAQIFLTATSNVGSSSQSITTIKYTNAANPAVIWTSNYDNTGTTDKGLQLVMNGTDPVIVGEKFGTNKDFILLGYATADGSNYLATTVGQDPAYSDVQFCQLTIGTGSNIYVGIKGKTGATSFMGTAYKYTFGGFLLSTITFSGTGSLLDDKLRVLELSSDIIIAQANQNQSSLAVQRFNSSNVAVWTSAYTENNFRFADAKSESTSPIGIYITGANTSGTDGNDARIIKLNVGGTSTYATNYDNSSYVSNESPSSLIVTQSGAAALSGLMSESNGNQKLFTVGFNTSGTQSGGLRIISDQNDNIRNIVTDGSGNVYVSGNTADAAPLNDIFVSKYSSAGALLWNVRIGVSSKDETTGPRQLAVDASGNVFVSGTVLNANNDILISCLRSSDGAFIGNATFNGSANSSDIPHAIAVDGSSNVYITGETRVSGANRNIAILKYNKFCVQQTFASSYEGTAAGNDIGKDIVLDASGNVYIVGESATTASGTTDIITLKYSNTGTQLWVNALNSSNGVDVAGGITLDGLNNVYITGGVVNSSLNSDAVTVKYSTLGAQIWLNTYNNGTNSESGADISVNSNFEVGVGGQSVVGVAQDILIVKINPDGSNNYGTIYNGAGNSNDFERNMFINPSGNIFIGGQFVNTGSNTDGVLLHYNNAGVLTSNSIVNIGSTDNVSRVFFDNSNNVYIGGSTNASSPNDAFFGRFAMPVTNEAPQVSNIANQTTCGAAVGPLSFTVLDEDISTVTVSANSSNISVIPNSNISIGGSGNARTITVSPLSGQSGLITISVIATDASSNITTKTFTIDVSSIPPTPTISASGSTAICSGGNITLTSSSLTGNLWSTGETTQAITVSTANNYSVTVSNSCGSATSIATSTTIISAPTTPTIIAGSATTFCSPGAVTLTSSSSTNNTWSNGSNAANITVTTSGNYTVTVSNSCGSATSAATSITVNSLPAIPTISADGPTTFCTPGSVNLTSSSSSNNTWSNGSTLNNINVTTSGNYTVSVANSCGSVSSSPTTVTVNNCSGYNGTGLFPNSQCGYITQPPNGSIISSSITGAVQYKFDFYQVGSSIIFASRTQNSPAINLGTITTPSTGTITNSPFNWGTQYDVTVTPIGAGNALGNPSQKCRLGFMVQPTPSNIPTTSLSTPACISSPTSAVIISNNATIRCSAVAQASTFQFKFENVANSSNVVIANQSGARTRTLAPLNLTPGATYAVSVRATIYGVQATNFGPICYIKMAGGVKEIINGEASKSINNQFKLSVTPNPVLEDALIAIATNDYEKVNLSITDIAGKIIYENNVISNSNFELKGLGVTFNSGIYFITAILKSGDRKTIKFVIR